MRCRGLIPAAAAGNRTQAGRGDDRPLVGALDDLIRCQVRCRVAARGGQRQAGQGKPFEPGPGRVMTEWLELHAASDQDWTSLAEEALAFVGGAPE